MKKISLTLASFAIAGSCYTQTTDTLEINNIHAVFNPEGSMFYDINTGGTFIAAPGNAITYSVANLWIGGIDNYGKLNVSAQTYRQTGTDFWPGPLDTIHAYCPLPASPPFNTVWDLKCSEVDTFISNTLSPIPGFTVPSDIQSWPGNGNAAFGQSYYLAPFADVDGDGLYSFQAGDYPLVRGTQSLFYLYNDSLQNNPHGETNSSSIGMQIQAMPYAYYDPWDDALMNTIFVHYKIRFMSPLTYTGTTIGLWSDFDFSGGQNAVASDSILGAAFQYNADNAVAMYFLSEPMGGVIAYENSFSTTGNPVTPLDYYELLNRKWTPGNDLTYGGSGISTGPTTDWMYTGNPATNTGWLDTGGADRRTLATTDSFTVTPGMTREFVIAYSFSHDTTSSYASMAQVQQYVTHIRQFYAGNNGYCNPVLSSVTDTETSTPVIYPNPAVNSITVSSTTPSETYSVIDVNGQIVLHGIVGAETFHLDISGLSTGVYLLQLTTNKEISTTRFVKSE